MIDHGRTEQALALLAKPGVYEMLHTLHTQGGVATFAQLAAHAPKALALLRSLATEEFVVAVQCGSLDIEPHAQAHFTLTARGQAVAGHVIRLSELLSARASGRNGRRSIVDH